MITTVCLNEVAKHITCTAHKDPAKFVHFKLVKYDLRLRQHYDNIKYTINTTDISYMSIIVSVRTSSVASRGKGGNCPPKIIPVGTHRVPSVHS